jgi:glycerol-3-phosphate dehydrogenase (NAD(P)+)
MSQISLIGGGSWGSALAIVLARNGHEVRLWTYEPELAAEINQHRRNSLYLPDFPFPSSIQATPLLEEALPGAGIVVLVVPTQHCRGVLRSMRPWLHPDMIFVSAAKGLELSTHHRMSEVIGQELGADYDPRIAVVSGPSFAQEVVRGDPTAVVVASRDAEVARAIQRAFSGPTLRLYTNPDVVGVELAGAVKNVVAISAGICQGLNFGHNTIAALITRGLAEMTRLAIACGGKRETLAGLAGMGDLVLTCTGALSRNRAVGVEIGKGHKLAEIMKGMRMVAEGVMTTRATLDLARLNSVEMPITEQMDLVINQDKNPREAIRDLMERRLTGE